MRTSYLEFSRQHSSSVDVARVRLNRFVVAQNLRRRSGRHRRQKKTVAHAMPGRNKPEVTWACLLEVKHQAETELTQRCQREVSSSRDESCRTRSTCHAVKSKQWGLDKI